MGTGRWREFRYRGVAFDVLEGRFLRIRCRDLDQPGQRAYLVVDLLTLKPMPDPEYKQATVRRQRASAAD